MTTPTNPQPREVLKPCPFCGGEPVPGTWLHPADVGIGDLRKRHVFCGHCGAQGPNGTHEEAVAAWDTRQAAEPSAQPGEREAIAHEERVEYEERILAIEMMAERLKRLIRLPEERGSYVGDTYYPVGGVEASHEWNGKEWEWHPGLRAPRADIVEGEGS